MGFTRDISPYKKEVINLTPFITPQRNPCIFGHLWVPFLAMLIKVISPHL